MSGILFFSCSTSRLLRRLALSSTPVGIHTHISASRGETSVESHDFPIYHKKAKSRGTTFVNCYDLGKLQNLELFFNVGTRGEYSYLTLIFPYRISPYTDGRAWARRPGLTRHLGVERIDEYTDDDDDDTSEP
ncbi:hypothetical protein APHAL10511_008405 [Amanita phalloides]|nr:hypothetical protein APHAL10511_008405 [Amanita phalloides]